MDPLQQPNLLSVLDATIEVAKQAGSFLMHEIRQVKPSDIRQKGTHDFVSYVDETAERLIVDGLKGLWPDAGFITEEGTERQNESDYHWIIDPLDGTTNFLHGVPLYSVSIALVHRRTPVVGVVYEPNLDECFSAAAHHPARLNGELINVSHQRDHHLSLLATGFPYRDYGRMKQYMDLFTHFAQNSSGLRRLGSAAVDLVYTACGRFDAFYEYGLKPWDVAAGALIVQQAGGKVSDFDGGDDYIFGTELLASNGYLHEGLLADIREWFV